MQKRGVDKKDVMWYNKDMKKQNENLKRKCPECGKEDRQWKYGFNASGTQKYRCGHCGRVYTLEPKRHAYDEETRELALKIYYAGASGRAVGKILHMSKANVYNWIKKNGNGCG